MNMQSPRYFCALSAFAVFATTASAQVARADVDCPVSIPETKLLGHLAPSPLDWFGSDSLAVRLPSDGVWRGTGPERDFFDKLFWLVAGFRSGLEDEFTIAGRRLDGGGSSLEPIVSGVTHAGHDDFGGPAVLTGLGFPTPGCWEVTGSFQGQQLTFVVQVVDAGRSKQ